MVGYSLAHRRRNETLIAGPLLTNVVCESARSRDLARVEEVVAVGRCRPDSVGFEI